MTELDELLGDMVEANNSIEEAKQKDEEMNEQIEVHKEQQIGLLWLLVQLFESEQL